MCGKFEEGKSKPESEIADKSVRSATQSRDPPNFSRVSNTNQLQETSTFSTLRVNWKAYVPRKIIWKQQVFNFSHNGFSLVDSLANKKRGGQEKGSAGKRFKK